MPEISLVVPTDHPCLAGHFPGNPIVPGVVILDFVVAKTNACEIINVKFKSLLKSGEACILELAGPKNSKQKFIVRRGDDVIATGLLRKGATA